MVRLRSVPLALFPALLCAGCASDITSPSSDTHQSAPVVGRAMATTAATAWNAEADVPSARGGQVAATVRPGEPNARIYLFGGYEQNPDDFEPVQVRRFNVYDPGRNRWVKKGSMPYGFYAANGAEVIEGKIYIAGGFQGTSTILSTMLEYSPKTDSWRTLPGPRPGAYGATGVIGGQLYVLTGWGLSRTIGYLDRYDPISGVWSSLPDAPHAHLAGGGAAIGGKLYVVGGISDGNFTVNGDLDVYDPVTNSWSSLAPMPNPRLLVAVTALNGKLYVFGGRTGGLNSTVVADVDVYDPATNTWSAGVPMPLARESAAVARVQPAPGTAFAYVMGGADLFQVLTANQGFDPIVP